MRLKYYFHFDIILYSDCSHATGSLLFVKHKLSNWMHPISVIFISFRSRSIEMEYFSMRILFSIDLICIENSLAKLI